MKRKKIRIFGLFTLMGLILWSCSLWEKEQVFEPAWQSQNSGSTASFRGLCVVSPEVVWASGSQGTVARTLDGGGTWHSLTFPGAEGLDFRDIQAFSADVALLLTAGLPARIYKTQDGGGSWRPCYFNETPGVFFDAMAFWDEQNGIAFSDPVEGSFLIITTIDGGETWQPVSPENIPPALPGEAGFAASGTCVAVQGKSCVWFGTGGAAARIFRSRDKGRTWEVSAISMLSGESSQGIFSLTFWDELNGVAVGGDYRDPEKIVGNAAITKDGGKTWMAVENTPPSGFRSCVAFIPGKKGPILVSVGTSGADYSRDGGQSWVRFDSVGYHSLGFTRSGDSGWAVGGDGRIARLKY